MDFNVRQCNQTTYHSAIIRLVYIEVNMVVMVLAATTLAIFGSSRRRSNNAVLTGIQWISYTLLTTILFSNTIGQMQSAQFRNELFALWAISLLILFASVDSFSALSLAGNEQWRKHFGELFFMGGSLGWITAFYFAGNKYYLYVFPGIIFILGYKVRERGIAMCLASKYFIERNTKLIADFMAHEHEIRTEGEPDPTDMRGYNYLVNGDTQKVKVTLPLYQKQVDITKAEIVTLQKVWQHRGRLLSGETGERLKDICLSFALFRLIYRKFGGHPFSESGHGKTWNLVRHGLLSKEDDYNRVFRVIEVELCFLFDLFYTKYAAIFKQGQGWNKLKLFDAIFIVLGCVVAAKILGDYKPSNENCNLITGGQEINIDKLVSGFVIVGVLFLEIAQLLCLMVSDWATVLWICSYVRGDSWLQNNDTYLKVRTKVILYSQEKLKPWGRKLDQYSLLESFNRDPLGWKLRRLIFHLLDVPRIGRKGSHRILLPEQVKKAVVLILRRDGPKLSNGEESLHRNGVWGDLSWACKLETTTHVILVWHLATSLCEIATKGESLMTKEDFTVATSLSNYCAYLVAFAPRLIFDNAVVSESIFDSVIIDARYFLSKCKSDEKKYARMMELGKGNDIIERAAVLVKNLVNLQKDLMWKVLADFWAEIMLFLAPTGDPSAHAEYLAKGGQFVTHLWALLSHAGILTQSQPSTSQDV
ncbi:hypothetical protein SLEP1_g55965 [Rubroshorea leprosula]|uniref:DUF4220 domain-containing protein n=1 Tax=Rubroshorea leprosula TaxID=152421 RepID=A0AAV5MI80_9ROSI|nr:hypothetical protein SLEP1_g55965 [Rubroshorea leprosula]